MKKKVSIVHNRRLLTINTEKQKTAKIIESVGSHSTNPQLGGPVDNIAKKIQSKEKRWKVLEDDSEDELGNIKVVDE